VTPDPPSGDGLAVPFLVDPEHEDVAAHVAEKRPQNFKYLVTNWINTDWSFWVFGVGLLVFSIIGSIIFFRSRRWM
jgi:hypothetical protein